MIESHKRKWSVVELLEKTQGDGGAFLSQKAIPYPIERVLITGATGRLGRHLARSLLRKNNCQILMLTRNQNDPQFLWNTPQLQNEAMTHQWHKRIECVMVGDLNQNQFPNLKFDTLIHCAADMSLSKNTDMLWSSNVLATQYLWAWAEKMGCQSFHHISTLSVWVASDSPSTLCMEEDRLDSSGQLYGGYAATKWAAEAWLLKKSKQSSLSLSIHRLGLLTFSHDEGWLEQDPLLNIMKSWKQWGKPLFLNDYQIPKHPLFENLRSSCFDWTPVDTCSDKLIESILKGVRGPLHWAAHQPIDIQAFFEILEKIYPNSLFKQKDWPRDLEGKIAQRALERFYNSSQWQKRWWMDLCQTDRHRFNLSHATDLVGPLWKSPTLEEWMKMAP